MIPSSAPAVQFDHYGGRDVLQVAELPMPDPAYGKVLNPKKLPQWQTPDALSPRAELSG